jgi:hypothetical protein
VSARKFNFENVMFIINKLMKHNLLIQIFNFNNFKIQKVNKEQFGYEHFFLNKIFKSIYFKILIR